MVDQLPNRIPSRFVREERLFSPELDPGKAGVRIGVDQVMREGEDLWFRLLITYALPLDHAASYRSVDDALVVVLRDAAGGKCAAFKLLDPTVNPLETPIKNFVDQRRPVASTVTSSAYVAVPLEVEIGAAHDHPGIFVHVALHGYLSNVLQIPEAQKP